MRVVSNPENIDYQKWKDYVINHPQGNIFHLPEYYSVCEKTKGYNPLFIIILSDNSEIEALLLAIIQTEEKDIGGILTSRSIIQGGPLSNDNYFLERLLFEYNKSISKRVIYSQIRNFTNTKDQKEIFLKHKFIFEDHLNIIIDLSIGKEKLWSNYSKSRRKGINKAKKESFCFQILEKRESIDTFYGLLKESYNRIGLPYPTVEFFNNISIFFPSCNFKIFGLRHNGSIVIAMFALIYKNKVFGFYMGMKNEVAFLKLKPADLFFHYFLNWCIDNNYEYYDWMGAGKPNENYGVRVFKQQFGGAIVNYGRYMHIHKPVIYKLGSMIISIRKSISK